MNKEEKLSPGELWLRSAVDPLDVNTVRNSGWPQTLQLPHLYFII